MKKIFYLMLVALTVGMFTACDDDDENTPQINNPEPKEQWGKTLRGDNQTLLAFPDIYADIGNTPILTKIIQTSASFDWKVPEVTLLQLHGL